MTMAWARAGATGNPRASAEANAKGKAKTMAKQSKTFENYNMSRFPAGGAAPSRPWDLPGDFMAPGFVKNHEKMQKGQLKIQILTKHQLKIQILNHSDTQIN